MKILVDTVRIVEVGPRDGLQNGVELITMKDER